MKVHKVHKVQLVTERYRRSERIKEGPFHINLMFKVSELVECGFVDGVNAWAIMNMQLHCYTMLHPAISKYIALGKLSTKLCGSFELSGMMWDALAANWRLCFDILTGVHCRILHRY